MRNYLKSIKGAQRLKISNFSSGIDYSLDESVMSPAVASDCANFDFWDGALKSSLGVKSAPFERAVAVWDFTRYDSNRDDYVTVTMFMSDDGTVNYTDPDSNLVKQLDGVVFTSPPLTVNYRLYDEDVIIMCSPTDRMVVWNGVDNAYSVPESPFISSMAMHYERLFVTTEGEKNAVWFSDDLDPTNWNRELDEGGFITLIDDRGRSNKVVDFLNYIYIFRDNGISRLTAYGDQTEFSVSNLFVSSGKIFADTVTLCGDKIYFLASDGLYVFDGFETQKILSNLDASIEGGTPYAAYCDGRYVLALRFVDKENADEESDKEVNNGLIVISPKGYSLIKGVSVKRLCPTNSGLFAALWDGRVGIIIDESGALFDAPLHKKWAMPQSDFGYIDLKILKDLRVTSTGKAEIKVKSDFGEKVFSTEEGDNRFFVNLMGHTFKIFIESDEKSITLNRFSLSFKR